MLYAQVFMLMQFLASACMGVSQLRKTIQSATLGVAVSDKGDNHQQLPHSAGLPALQSHRTYCHFRQLPELKGKYPSVTYFCNYRRAALAPFVV